MWEVVLVVLVVVWGYLLVSSLEAPRAPKAMHDRDDDDIDQGRRVSTNVGDDDDGGYEAALGCLGVLIIVGIVIALTVAVVGPWLIGGTKGMVIGVVGFVVLVSLLRLAWRF